MNREHVEKSNSSPEWRAAFEVALARAEALHGGENWDALAYATTSADIVIADAEEAKALKTQHEAAILADHHARQALAAHQQATAQAPQADPAARAKAGWAAAASKVNGVDARELAPTIPDNAPSLAAADGGKSGWAKAAAALNEQRGQ